MDRETFAKGMFILSAAYERHLDQDTLEVYYSFLNHLSPAELEEAARKHIKKSSWFPKISELLGAVQSLLPSAIEVWTKLLAAAEGGVKPEMDGPTKTALDFIGGWQQFCITSYDDLPFRFKSFKEAYEGAMERKSSRLEIDHDPHTLAQLEK
jgi:hypothetical protein